MNSPARRPATLLIGETRRAEFRDAAALLRTRTRLRRERTLEAAVDFVAAAREAPEIIVIAQSRPGEIDETQVETLRAAAPLARFVQLLGSWCEGETRSGHPWPAESRLFWHQFVPRMSDCFDQWERGECPEWGLPPAATQADQLVWARGETPDIEGALIAIHTRHFETYDTLADVFAGASWRSIWIHPQRAAGVSGATAGCFDGIGLEGDERNELRRFRGHLRAAPMVALFDFLRSDTRDLAREAGVDECLAKPYRVADLLACFRRLLCPATQVEGLAGGEPPSVPVPINRGR
ncbi:MAG: hypothetical protein KDA42_19085 [Planctomycetales bacterium]|nr:hypothetical protein [Planctomycetales bacterium]